MAEAARRPAFYAASPGRWRDWWTLLHPPYTAWHLSYVVIGACLAPEVHLVNLVATLLAFLAGVGLAAHALDELNGRPLGTGIPSRALVGGGTLGLAVAVALGALGVGRVGWTLIPFIALGPLLVVAYTLELAGGILHNEGGFAAAWGAFPVLTAYVAQTGTVALACVLAACGAAGLSVAQRRLSTPARLVRRQATAVRGRIELVDGQRRPIDEQTLLAPLEGALRALSWSLVLVAASLAVARLAPG